MNYDYSDWPYTKGYIQHKIRRAITLNIAVWTVRTLFNGKFSFEECKMLIKI